MMSINEIASYHSQRYQVVLQPDSISGLRSWKTDFEPLKVPVATAVCSLELAWVKKD